jgi:uncharacterized membrane protein YeaQ/YmgE (transglycosylase-associated protein family)
VLSETVVQLVPMLILGGLIAGWLAEMGWRAGGYGFIPDMVLGLAGSLLAGAFVWLVIWRDAGMTAMLLVGCAGATLAIFAQRGVWRSVPVARG